MIVYTVLVVVLSVASRGTAEIFPNNTVGQRACEENREYPHYGFCCTNCEAGTYVSEKCSADKQKGTCTPCETGTYAEHPTGMSQCLQCSQCHLDQIMTAICTSLRNTLCECKKGFYCLPDEPCEVCKKCTKCKSDEKEERPCTPTSNTRCSKRQIHDPTDTPATTPEHQSSASKISIGVLVGTGVLIVIGVGVWLWRKKKKTCLCRREESPRSSDEEVKIPIEGMVAPSAEERENNRNAGLEEVEPRPESRPLLQVSQDLGSKSYPVEDEDRGLGDSLPNTTSSSQTSLSVLPVTMVTMEDSPRHSPRTQRPMCNGERETETGARDESPLRRLVPLLDEETSLSKSFDLFDTLLDVRCHNKFFRSIGVSDNAIKLAEAQNGSGDKVYELLRVWMQRKGLCANINDLLQALIDLDQRYSAEQIASKAVERRFYRYE